MSTPKTTDNNLSKQVATNVGWNYLAFGLSKGLNIIAFSIIARLLTPELYGLFALATPAIDYLSILNDFGLGAALIHRRDDIDDASNTAFTLNVLIGAVLTGIVLIIAPFVAVFFKEPAVTPILSWLGVTFTINALGSIHRARLQREMQFGKNLVPELGNTIIKNGLAIWFAIKGYGAWSLVYGQLAGAGASTILLWVVVPWIPRLIIKFHIVKQLFSYGFSIMADGAMTTLADSFDYVLIGRFYNSAALGIYQIAYRLPELLVIQTLSILAAVFFPAFSSIQHQMDDLRKNFLATFRYVQLLITPICLGMFIAAEPIVKAILGEQWTASIPIMRILCLYALILSIGFHSGDIFKAIGRPDILLKLAIPVFIIRLVFIFIGARHSLIGIAYGHLAASVVELIIRTIVTIKVIKVKFSDLLKQSTSFIGGIALLAFAALALYGTNALNPWVSLIATITAGATGYIWVLWILERESIIKILGVIGIHKFGIPKETHG